MIPPKRVNVSIRVPVKLADQLRAVAAARGMSGNQFTQKLLEKELCKAEYWKILDALSKYKEVLNANGGV